MSGARNPIEIKRHACGYEPAMQRPRCGNCKYLREGSNPNQPEQCARFGFMVSVWAVCMQHEFKRPYQGVAASPGKKLSP